MRHRVSPVDNGQAADIERDHVRRTSWLTVSLGTLTACAVIATAAWVAGVRPMPEQPTAGLPVLLPSSSPTPTTTQRASESDTVPEQARTSEKPKSAATRRASGKPQVAVQLADTQEGRCAPTFALSVNAYVVKGQVDEATGVLSVPLSKIRRTRQLLDVAGDFSALFDGIPTKRTAKLTLTFRGPGGEVTEVHDVTHVCPGKPIDKVGKRKEVAGIPKIRKPKVEFDFDFDFDFGGKSTPRKQNSSQGDASQPDGEQ